MKCKVTKKEVRANYAHIFAVGYCGMQYLLRYTNPFAYSVRVEGWACDYYDVGGVCISTGYAPIGKSVPYDLVREYEGKAREACMADYDRDKVNALRDELIEKLLGER